GVLGFVLGQVGWPRQATDMAGQETVFTGLHSWFRLLNRRRWAVVQTLAAARMPGNGATARQKTAPPMIHTRPATPWCGREGSDAEFDSPAIAAPARAG